MGPRLPLALSALAVVLVLAWPAEPVRSQAPAREGFAGTWWLVPDVPSGRRTIRSAFERVLRNANALIRGIARERLDVDVQLPRRIEFAFDGAYITTTLRTSRNIRWHTREGYPTDVAGDDGSDARLTQHFRGANLELASTFPEGRRWIVFSREGDRLRMTTTIDAMMIDDNVHFSLPYRRR